MLALAAYAAVVHHVGAPKLPYTCTAPDHVARWWVPGGGPADVSPSVEVHWLGSTEIVGCGETLTIGLSTVPGPASAADRLVFGGHQHDLMGAVTGIYDQPDGKYVYLALAAAAVVAAARLRRWRPPGGPGDMPGHAGRPGVGDPQRLARETRPGYQPLCVQEAHKQKRPP